MVGLFYSLTPHLYALSQFSYTLYSLKNDRFEFLACEKFGVSMWRCGVNQYWRGIDNGFIRKRIRRKVYFMREMWRKIKFCYICRSYLRCKWVNRVERHTERSLGEVLHLPNLMAFRVSYTFHFIHLPPYLTYQW
jgi:hypothetical protein